MEKQNIEHKVLVAKTAWARLKSQRTTERSVKGNDIRYTLYKAQSQAFVNMILGFLGWKNQRQPKHRAKRRTKGGKAGNSVFMGAL